MPRKRPTTKGRDTSPTRPRTFIEQLIATWPTLTVAPGHDAIEDPTSPLAILRDSCVLTASKAGVLWNCKRGLPYGRFLDEALGRTTPVPFNDWTKSLMAAGTLYEPKINRLFCQVMAAEFHRIYGGSACFWLPGPFARDDTSATPDGLVTFRMGGQHFMMPYEIKFFASKAALPDTLPDDYVAQVLMQMVHARVGISMLVGAVLCDGDLLFNVWTLKAIDAAHADYETRLQRLRTDLKKKAINARTARTAETLGTLVVGASSDAVDLWEFITTNRDLLVSSVEGSGCLHFPFPV